MGGDRFRHMRASGQRVANPGDKRRIGLCEFLRRHFAPFVARPIRRADFVSPVLPDVPAFDEAEGRRQLERIGAKSDGESWGALANRAEASLQQYFWLEEPGYFADVLIARGAAPALTAVVDTALRSNCLFAISLGFVTGERAQRCVEAALRFLVVPGALRSLAPLPVSPPLPVYDSAGRLLNNPVEPYASRYEGDEDTRRKLAYHNGTAWTWTFPVFCEALARASRRHGTLDE